ncbi:hypothetical protein [Sanyastnella coralliicola]|uniref:hypothetical protein n=1 Tax=Sanyastnella coralliicola TaxID=3069118 RepID=UPI0027B9194B|nr:hypothetical protein [Longitalea sp. SCSIO 12813]
MQSKRFILSLLMCFGLVSWGFAQTSPYCDTQVYHFGNPAETASSVFLTITNVDASSMMISVESADADAVDDLIIPGGSGAAISAIDASVPGVLSRTLSWGGTPPAVVNLNVLWSKASFPGNWQVNTDNFDVNFADNCAPATGITLTMDACDANPTEVRMTGEFWGWDPAGGPVASDNGDGTWTVTLDPMPGADMQYLWVMDGVQENLLDNAVVDLSCTPVTDGANFANRLWTVGSGNVNGDVYDSCEPCPIPPLTLTVDVCDAMPTEVRMTGEFWGWDPAGGPVASDNGDGTWTVTLDPAPAADMQYLWVLDGTQENMLDNAVVNLACTPVTDGANFANRLWTVGSPDVTGDYYDTCGDCNGDGVATSVALTVDVCDATPTEVRMTGEFWGWDPAGGPVASDNGDGTWTVTLDPAPAADMQYLWVVDGVQENMLDNAVVDLSCTPVTDGANFANRLWTVGSPDVTGDVYDTCGNCDGGVGGSPLTLTVNVCSATPTEVRMTGEFWGWDPAGGPVASDNGDGTWTVTLDPAPAADMQYLWVLDGVQENVLDNAVVNLSCTPITDGANFANRLWVVGDPNVTDDYYDTCGDCNGDGVATSVSLTVEVCDGMPTEVRMTGEFWGWDPAGGPVASDNGDGTWTVLLDPAPAADMQYLWVVDGVQENLLDNMPQDLSCTPITDGANFANRLWTVGSPDVTGDAYDTCTGCAVGVEGCTDPTAANYDMAATIDNGSCAYLVSFSVDMNEYGAAFGYVNVSGAYNGWCGDCNQLTDDDMDGVWTGTFAVTNGLQQYKFTIDNWVDQENFAGGESCTITNGDGFTNRTVDVMAADVVLDTVCFNSCYACTTGETPGCNDATASNYDPTATVNDGSCMFDVTFRVDMSNYGAAFTEIHLNGQFNGWCGNCAPMFDQGGGIWELIVPLQEGTYEFLYTVDGAIFESMMVDAPCTVTNFGFTNRFIQVTGNQSTIDYCWEECGVCDNMNVSGCTDGAAQNYNPAATIDDGSCSYLVTLNVDMNQYAGAFTTVSVFGTFNGWDPNANPMDDADMDGVYTVTVTMTNGDNEYKFIVDGTTDEIFVGGEPCTVSGGGFTNRLVSVSGDTTVGAVCWESCNACPSAFYDVTFRVDMWNEMVAAEGVHIAGSFQGWDASATPMTYLGYGIYEFTVTIGEGETIQYKYINGNDFAGEETVPMECGVDNGLGAYNRSHTVGGADEVLALVCFGECDACAGCTDPLSTEYNPFAGSDDGSCMTPIAFGCTYPDADNYDASANTDDGSCTFTTGNDCPEDLNQDGIVNAADLLQFLAAFGTSC